MKLFSSGLLCGAILSISISSYGLSTTNALSEPSRILFHFNNSVVEVDGSETGVLYYKNRAYVPLRTFSETVGAAVNYQAPSGKSDGMSLIDVYLK